MSRQQFWQLLLLWHLLLLLTLILFIGHSANEPVSEKQNYLLPSSFGTTCKCARVVLWTEKNDLWVRGMDGTWCRARMCLVDCDVNQHGYKYHCWTIAGSGMIPYPDFDYRGQPK